MRLAIVIYMQTTTDTTTTTNTAELWIERQRRMCNDEEILMLVARRVWEAARS